MISLKQFSRKNVRVTYKDGDVVIGFVSCVDEIESNEDGIETMTLEETGLTEYLSVSAAEVKTIEVIE